MSIDAILLPVKNELLQVEEELTRAASSDVELVRNASLYVLQNGGKRLRPAVLLLVSRLLGVSDTAKAVKLSTALELVHAASLLHDDVLDNATLRRGKPSANVKWGNQISILVGDFLWCTASRIAIENGNPAIFTLLINAVEKTTEGEILEIVHSNDFSLSKEAYLKIIELKTAMLFKCASEVGAAAGGAQGAGFVKELASYGLNLGIAFQLADDVLDYVSVEEKFGKRAGTDLCEGRLTLPVILALQKCNEEEKGKILNALLAKGFDESMFLEIKKIFEKYSTIKESLALAREYSAKAKEGISQFKSSIIKDSLLALAEYAVSRSN